MLLRRVARRRLARGGRHPVRSICAHPAHSPHRAVISSRVVEPTRSGRRGLRSRPWDGGRRLGSRHWHWRDRRRLGSRHWRWRDRRRGRRRRRRRDDQPRCLPPCGRSPDARPLSGHVRSRRPQLARERRDRFTRQRRRVGDRARIVRDDAYRLDLRLISARCDQSRGDEGASDGDEGGGRSDCRAWVKPNQQATRRRFHGQALGRWTPGNRQRSTRFGGSPARTRKRVYLPILPGWRTKISRRIPPAVSARTAQSAHSRACSCDARP